MWILSRALSGARWCWWCWTYSGEPEIRSHFQNQEMVCQSGLTYTCTSRTVILQSSSPCVIVRVCVYVSIRCPRTVEFFVLFFFYFFFFHYFFFSFFTFFFLLVEMMSHPPHPRLIYCLSFSYLISWEVSTFGWLDSSWFSFYKHCCNGHPCSSTL